VVLVLGWEGLGIRSFFLINFRGRWESYGNSFTTLITMRIGDFFIFLFFRDFLYNIYFRIPQLTYVNRVAFLLFAATKSALFPFSG
jgi:NADH:ubiquinone oxidoreductase subunit 5 (subunit L)/multisubunit Na+/H+ antiporter MnhA subunit